MSTQTQGSQSEKQGNGSDVMSGLSSMAADSPQQQTEGKIAKAIESQTSKLPSDTFLWAAVGAMAVSAICEFSGAKDKSRFVGQWVAPFLLFGVYNKLVKQQGHDRMSA
jgi:hypothetical protein